MQFTDEQTALVERAMLLGEQRLAIETDGDHGPQHWLRVMRNGLAICRHEPAADPLTVALFAALHDCCREDEYTDRHHGERAAKMLRGMINDGSLFGAGPRLLNAEQLAALEIAICYHSDGEVAPSGTIAACWDADRLDLGRVGAYPSPLLLSTAWAKRIDVRNLTWSAAISGDTLTLGKVLADTEWGSRCVG